VLALADPEVADREAPLPFARREADRMGRRLGDGSTVLAGDRATERALAGDAPAGYRMIHFAAHAVVHDEEPERSAVLLAPTEPGDDGRLTFREIVSLDLDGQVVLLSACRTGSGPVVGGEGILGLANAFFHAGARTVVAGLWPVRDRETAALVDAFGEHLAAGTSVAGALAAARRERMSRGDPAAAWAGMIVLGDGDLVPFPSVRPSTPGWTWAAAFALGVLLTAVLVYLSRRR
jgi:CHAT domain-containing protein